MKIYLKKEITIWYSETQDIAVVYLTFSDETQMKIHYKKITEHVLKPTQIRYENRVVTGITAELDATDKQFQWKLKLIIPEMNLDETFNFYLNKIKEDSCSMVSIENLQQALRLKRASLTTVELLSDQQQAERIKKKKPKKDLTALEMIGWKKPKQNYEDPW